MFCRLVGSIHRTRTYPETRLVSRTQISPTTAVLRTRRATETQARCHHTASCRCGQQLDLCARAHCPRCGREIGRS